MGIVESHQSCAVWCVQTERVGQTVRPIRRAVDARDVELEPVSLLEMVLRAIGYL